MLSCLSRVWLFATLWTNLPGSYVHGILQKENGVGSHVLLQEILLSQGLNPSLLCLLRWQACSLALVPPGKP